MPQAWRKLRWPTAVQGTRARNPRCTASRVCPVMAMTQDIGAWMLQPLLPIVQRAPRLIKKRAQFPCRTDLAAAFSRSPPVDTSSLSRLASADHCLSVAARPLTNGRNDWQTEWSERTGNVEPSVSASHSAENPGKISDKRLTNTFAERSSMRDSRLDCADPRTRFTSGELLHSIRPSQ